jgi:hypothetical protein
MSISSSSSSSLFAVDVDVDWLWGLAEDNGIDEVCAVSMFDGSDAGFISTAAAGFSKIISVLMCSSMRLLDAEAGGVISHVGGAISHTGGASLLLPLMDGVSFSLTEG